MTKTQFLSLFKHHLTAIKPETFLIKGFISLRLKGRAYCPITFVTKIETGRYYHPTEFAAAAAKLGLNYKDALTIAKASETVSRP